MTKDIHFEKKDCLAVKPLNKLACALNGPDWESIRITPTSSLDEVTERCKRCRLERLQPKW
ncbi:hypothetical protein [Massilia sp. TWP1-3-3]|uniref:hypothetical protein n=1 Tax=Massilia sp. TWP1-3-3 TaxID=2804573 RepID=UPI003CF99229